MSYTAKNLALQKKKELTKLKRSLQQEEKELVLALEEAEACDEEIRLNEEAARDEMKEAEIGCKGVEAEERFKFENKKREIEDKLEERVAPLRQQILNLEKKADADKKAAQDVMNLTIGNAQAALASLKQTHGSDAGPLESKKQAALEAVSAKQAEVLRLQQLVDAAIKASDEATNEAKTPRKSRATMFGLETPGLRLEAAVARSSAKFDGSKQDASEKPFGSTKEQGSAKQPSFEDQADSAKRALFVGENTPTSSSPTATLGFSSSVESPRPGRELGFCQPVGEQWKCYCGFYYNKTITKCNKEGCGLDRDGGLKWTCTNEECMEENFYGENICCSCTFEREHKDPESQHILWFTRWECDCKTPFKSKVGDVKHCPWCGMNRPPGHEFGKIKPKSPEPTPFVNNQEAANSSAISPFVNSQETAEVSDPLSFDDSENKASGVLGGDADNLGFGHFLNTEEWKCECGKVHGIHARNRCHWCLQISPAIVNKRDRFLSNSSGASLHDGTSLTSATKENSEAKRRSDAIAETSRGLTEQVDAATSEVATNVAEDSVARDGSPPQVSLPSSGSQAASAATPARSRAARKKAKQLSPIQKVARKAAKLVGVFVDNMFYPVEENDFPFSVLPPAPPEPERKPEPESEPTDEETSSDPKTSSKKKASVPGPDLTHATDDVIKQQYIKHMKEEKVDLVLCCAENLVLAGKEQFMRVHAKLRKQNIQNNETVNARFEYIEENHPLFFSQSVFDKGGIFPTKHAASVSLQRYHAAIGMGLGSGFDNFNEMKEAYEKRMAKKFKCGCRK